MAPEIAGDGSRRRHEREEAAGGGGVEARSRVLADRLRRGVIRREHLSIAGWLEDPAARRMVEPWVPAVPLHPSGGHPVSHALFYGPLEHRVLAWLASDFAARVLTRFETVCPGDARPRRAIEGARAWAACPCEEHRVAADGAAVAAHIGGVLAFEATNSLAADAAARAAVHAARVAADGDAERTASKEAGGAASSAADAAREAADADLCVLLREGLVERHVAAAERAAAGRAGAEAERAWQRSHLIAALTGDVTAPLPLTPPRP